MPLHLIPNRRKFLMAASATAALSTRFCGRTWAASNARPPIALLSDTHIPAEPSLVWRNANMTENLNQVIAELMQMQPLPSHVFINGDCAHLAGMDQDYQNLCRCLKPLVDTDVQLHLTLGNHDCRERILNALGDDWSESVERSDDLLRSSKFVSVLKDEHVNWVLLDSLRVVNHVTGELGDDQLQWLEGWLIVNQTKPALVLVHHNLQFDPPDGDEDWGGLMDTDALWKLLQRFENVKAVVHGHIHSWERSERDGKTIVGLPPTAYVFDESKPNGFTLVSSTPERVAFRLRTLDGKHPANEEVFTVSLER